MKTEPNGGSGETRVTQKLARLYEMELDRAERDFPTMRLPELESAEGAPRPRMKVRLLTEAVAIVAVGAIIVAGGWLASNPTTPAGPAPGASVPLGADGIPNQVAGEKVYRATDQVSFPTSGRFLLGGVFMKPDFVPPCPAPINKTAAEQQLLPYCFIQTIDGLQISPKNSIDEPRYELVVVRAHINDPLAVDCPAATLADCRAAIVVESVVWHSDAAVQVSPSSGTAGPGSTMPSNGTTVDQSGPSESAAYTPGSAASVVAPPPPIDSPLPNAS